MRLACVILLAALPPAFASVDESGNFAYYQIILDRMPFGNTTAAAAAGAAAPANPNQPPLSSILRLVALEKNDKTGAIQAGIVDAVAKKNHYLAVGGEADGLKLVEVDYTGDRALVRKGDQEEWLSMGGERGSRSPAPTLPPEIEERRSAFLRNRQARLATPAPPPPLPAPTVQTNEPPKPPWNTPEEMKEFYRKKNLDFIRSGKPPLPIRLTPEDDAQLVKEGVLPPVTP